MEAEYLATILTQAGYRVDQVANAQDSRVLLGRWKYGCWVLNTHLPDAADALALVEELQNELADTRVVLLASIGSERAALASSKRHRIADWLVKSDSRERIVEVVNQAIGRALPRTQAAA